MSDGNSKEAQNAPLSFELGAWLDRADRLDQAATAGPWAASAHPEWPQVRIGRVDRYDHNHRDGGIATTYGERIGRTDPADAEWIAHARTALPKATAALRATLDLHTPSEYGCVSECRDQSGGLSWPCPTVQAVQSALCGHERRGITYRDPTTVAYACESCDHEWMETR